MEVLIAHGQDLVDQQDLGFDVDGDGEAEPHEHARRVVLHRVVDEPWYVAPSELDDGIEAGVDVPLREAEDRAVEVDVLPPREFAVESCAQFEECRHRSVEGD